MYSEKILFVDDDQNILDSFKRSLRNDFSEIYTANGGLEGLNIMKNKGPIAVVISDYQMPEINGVQFLAATQKISADTIRIMLTGQADIQGAIDAVNKGNLFRFLLKPCSIDELTNIIIAGIDQHRLIIAERELLGKTLNGTIKVLTDILAVISPAAFSHSSRVSLLAKRVAGRLQITNLWEAEIAAMLSQIGCVTIPGKLLEKKLRGEFLSDAENEMFLEHTSFGKNLIANIPRLEGVAEAIAYQEKEFNGGGYPRDSRKGENIPLIGRILKAIQDFDLMRSGGKTEFLALKQMREQPDVYDSNVLDALEAEFSISPESYTILNVKVDELIIGMITAEDIIATSGVLLVSKGQEITEIIKKRLLNFTQFDHICEPIRVLERKNSNKE